MLPQGVKDRSGRVTLMANGVRIGFPGDGSGGGERSVVQGLSAGAARRNKAFLMSVCCDKFDPSEFCASFTYTLPDVPASPGDWLLLRKRLRDLWRRWGVVRWHYVVEWTRRGVPHIHGIVFFSPGGVRVRGVQVVPTAGFVVGGWLKVAASFGVSASAQHCVVQVGRLDVAWLMYMSKHASRGVGHYQRQREALPEGWDRTGRLWACGGEWPVWSETHDIPLWLYHRFRRVFRRYRRGVLKADLRRAVAAGDDFRAGSLRRSLAFLRAHKRLSNPQASSVSPLNEWVSPELCSLLLESCVF